MKSAESSPLRMFGHHAKLPVDIGASFLGLANAGAKMGEVGGVTASVLTALIV